jgi:hypothetical protein
VGQTTPWGGSRAGDKLYLGRQLPRAMLEIDLASSAESTLYGAEATEDLKGRHARVDVRSRDGLMIPVQLRRGAVVRGQAPAAFSPSN